MPTLTATALEQYPNNTYPIGKRMSGLVVPAECDFVLAQASDALDGGDISDLGAYVKPNWPAQVGNAYNANKLMIAGITARIDGNNYPLDIQNPDNDRQLQGFLYALKNKTYAGIALTIASDDSPAATIRGLDHFYTQLTKYTGRRVFLVMSKVQFETGKTMNADWGDDECAEFARLIQSSFGHEEYSKGKSLFIICDYETEAGKPIETVGNWGISRDSNVIWERQPGEYVMWMDFGFNAEFLGYEWPEAGTVEPTPTPVPTPTPTPTPVEYDDDLTAQIYGLRQDLRVIFSGLEPL